MIIELPDNSLRDETLHPLIFNLKNKKFSIEGRNNRYMERHPHHKDGWHLLNECSMVIDTMSVTLDFKEEDRMKIANLTAYFILGDKMQNTISFNDCLSNPLCSAFYDLAIPSKYNREMIGLEINPLQYFTMRFDSPEIDIPDFQGVFVFSGRLRRPVQ